MAVLSTGDEVVEIDATPGPAQIRNSNSYSLAAQAQNAGGEAVRLAIAPDGSHKLVIENQTKRPLPIELRLEYAKAFNKMPGRNDVSFAAPQAPINRWKVRVPEGGASSSSLT